MVSTTFNIWGGTESRGDAFQRIEIGGFSRTLSTMNPLSPSQWRKLGAQLTITAHDLMFPLDAAGPGPVRADVGSRLLGERIRAGDPGRTRLRPVALSVWLCASPASAAEVATLL